MNFRQTRSVVFEGELMIGSGAIARSETPDTKQGSKAQRFATAFFVRLRDSVPLWRKGYFADQHAIAPLPNDRPIKKTFDQNEMNKTTRRRTEISIETHEITIVRTSGTRLTAFCEACREDVPAFGLEQIAAVFQMSVSDVCRTIEEKKLHLVTARHSIALICGNSLKG
jgi:hypothetical protein